MKTVITMIVGLPGSGKSTLANKIASESDNSTFLATDFSTNIDSLLSQFVPSKHHNLIVTDPMLCGIPQDSAEDSILELFNLTRNMTKFSWIYFENDVEACLVNAWKTPRLENLDAVIRLQSKKYTIPEGAKVVSVYRTLH